ncbi:CIA30 family protein [uncultured Polaribacter sp.]|uniref:CIA30 family protein n=1 Tax=uncultured Polaribacter sp. TaxID=174711 RepID=UPI0026214792|nr:CIA30 family protein [uncultured Polaribacter sp.]
MSNFNTTIFDFNSKPDISSWRVVNDSVMGGVSEGNFKTNATDHGVFYGKVSTQNNGGFSSLRYRFSSIEIKNFTEVVLRVKGDGKQYQFRVKDSLKNSHSFVAVFQTTNQWQTIIIKLSDMYPAFRGKKLQIKNFSSAVIEEIAFLIANKKTEAFKLEIDKLYFQ